ncbi:MAG: DNA repair protein RecO [Candidatus Saccharimonadales bacterium]
MHKRFRTKAIILNRTDYGEADRIISFLTPDHGKVKAIAKGVRKSQSKLAGGIELFSVSDISFIPGRREISTVVSTRLIKHYGNIVKDLDRTQLAYKLIKQLDKATEDAPETTYFDLLQEAFAALDDFAVSTDLTELWFNMQLLRLAGHTPDLRTDTAGNKLSPDQKYNFDFEKMRFTQEGWGKFTADQIKFLRLGFSPNTPHALSRIKGSDKLLPTLQPMVQSMLQNYIRI